jgi:hypothetical protein
VGKEAGARVRLGPEEMGPYPSCYAWAESQMSGGNGGLTSVLPMALTVLTAVATGAAPGCYWKRWCRCRYCCYRRFAIVLLPVSAAELAVTIKKSINGHGISQALSINLQR